MRHLDVVVKDVHEQEFRFFLTRQLYLLLNRRVSSLNGHVLSFIAKF